MDLSVIIVNWNTRELLRGCLASLERGCDGLEAEVIVVDNASGDDSPGMVRRRFPAVRLIEAGGNLGFGRANNLGAAAATSPLLLFLNPDTAVTPEALPRLVGFMGEHPEVGAAGCKMTDAAGRVQELGVQRFPTLLSGFLELSLLTRHNRRRLGWLLPYQDPARSAEVVKLYGACLMVRRRVFQEVGGFDERYFMYCEDVELCERIRRRGWRLRYLSDVEIVHYGAQSSRQAPSDFSVLMKCESRQRLIDHYYGPRRARCHRGLVFLGAGARLLACALGRPLSGHSGSARKYLKMVQWSLGLAQARPATGTGESGKTGQPAASAGGALG